MKSEKNMKPILINTQMVKALLADGKMEVRRGVSKDIYNNFDIDGDGSVIAYIDQATGDSYPPTYPAQYQPGDILYVRETWSFWPCWDCDIDCNAQYKGWYQDEEGCFVYKTQSNKVPHEDKWRPSIHMPKTAARIFLRVTGVHVERLKDISWEWVYELEQVEMEG